MNKRFVFVNLAINTGWDLLKINHGMAFLAAILKKYNYEIKVIHLTREISSEEFINKIKKLNPSIVGFSCSSHQLKYLTKYSKALGKSNKILQITGGAHPTIDPVGTLNQTSVNGVCIGEGEIPLTNLLENIKNEKNIFDTRGFYWNGDTKIKKNPIPQFITDLSTIKFPDYSIFGKNFIAEKDNPVRIILTRGCPYDCSYCCNKALSNVYPSNKNYFRAPSVEYSIKLLEKIVREYPGIKSIQFEDENLIANKKWFEDFTGEYRKKINLPYSLCGRFESLNPDIVRALKDSRCDYLSIGIESGSKYLRDTILNRKYTNRLIIEKSKMIKKAGIKLFTFNIVGLPFETEEQMKETLKLNKKTNADYGVCFFFYPYKGTELYKICTQNNLLKSEREMNEITNYITKPAIKMSEKQEKSSIKFNKKINSYFSRRKEREKDGLIFYYSIRQILKFSKFLKTKSRLYENLIIFFKILLENFSFLKRLPSKKIK